MLLEIQRDERKRQLAKKMKKMKDDFNNEWDLKSIDLRLKAKNRITSYIENPNNKLTIDMRFERLKREFYQPPTPETVEREKMLTDPKNIAFLYVDAKLRATNTVIADLIPSFDRRGKGYLTYTEFEALLLSTGKYVHVVWYHIINVMHAMHHVLLNCWFNLLLTSKFCGVTISYFMLH